MADDDKKNISTSGGLPSNFGQQSSDDTKKHEEAENTDEQVSDETSPLGSMSEEVVEDTEELARSMGIHAGENNPLHSDEDLDTQEE